MINNTVTRGKYILKPTVPSGTVTVDYTVKVSGQLNGSTNISASTVFVGKSRYFGGDYEVDCSDWIDAFITKYNKYNGSYTTVNKVTVAVEFIFTDENNLTSGQDMSCVWEPMVVLVTTPTFDNACGNCQLTLYNSGFYSNWASTSTPLRVKILTQAGHVVGKSINNLEKTDYMDRYGDKHNGSITNHYEIECYVDPDWFHFTHYSDVSYNYLMTAMQSAKAATLGPTSNSVCGFPGISYSGGTILEGRVKNVEKVEAASIYSSGQKVPTMKITFEVYR